jgi:hypothetical protein
MGEHEATRLLVAALAVTREDIPRAKSYLHTLIVRLMASALLFSQRDFIRKRRVARRGSGSGDPVGGKGYTG